MLVFGAFVALPVKERFCGVKTLQRCSGAPVWLSWLAQYSWDLINCIPAISIVLIVFNIATDIDAIDTFAANTAALFVLFILFIFAQLPWCYCFSYSFKHPSSAIMYTNIANIILAQALLITVFILTMNGKVVKLKSVNIPRVPLPNILFSTNAFLC